MINNTIKQAYIKRKVFKTLSEKSRDRKFEFVDRLRDPIVVIPSKTKLPDTDLNLHQKGIRISNTPIEGYSISPEEFKLLEVAENNTVLFERGQIYNFGEKDFSNANIVVKGYGAGVDAIIRGSSDISTLSWTDEGGGIWSTPMAEEPNWIWINGECAKLAETARISITGRPSTTQFTVSAASLSGYSNIVGSTLVCKVRKFRMSVPVKITTYSSGTITVDTAIDVNLNVDLALYNKFEFFIGNNEWAWESGELRVKAAASPATMNIRVSSYDYCFKDTANTEFDALEFKEYYQFGIWSDSGVSNIHDCNFHDIRDTAIRTFGNLDGLNISANTFTRIENCGIMTTPMSNSTINNNTLSTIGMGNNYGWQTYTYNHPTISGFGTTTLAGIVCSVDYNDDTYDGTTNQFNGNTLSNIGYGGIMVGTTTNNTINNCQVNNFLNRLTDGSGIYIFHYRVYDIDQENTEIANCLIFDGNGAGGTGNIGIYVDNRSKAAHVHNNVVHDVDWGIFFNYDTTDHNCHDNTVFNFTQYGIVFLTGDSNVASKYTGNDMANNSCNNNIIAVNNSSARCMAFIVWTGSFPTWNPYGGTGGADNNIYINFSTTDIAFSTNDSDMSLAELRTNLGNDANSIYRATKFGNIVNSTTSAISDQLARVDFVSASTQAVRLGTTADVQFTNTSAWSASLWFKTTTNTQILLSNFNSSGRGIDISIQPSGVIWVQMTNTTGTNRTQLSTVNAYNDGQWHHLLIVNPGTPASTLIYVDNVSDVTTVSNNLSATTASTEVWAIGYRPATSTFYLDGSVDEVAIWNSYQNANRNAIYNSGNFHDMSLLAAPPLHYWRIRDEITDAAKYEDTGTSANKLNGTGVNTPLITGFDDPNLTEVTDYTLNPREALIYLL